MTQMARCDVERISIWLL